MPEQHPLEQEPVKEEIVKSVSDFEDAEGNHPEIEVNRNAPGAFVFDLDGTLIEGKELHFESMFSVMAKNYPQDPRFKGRDFYPEFCKIYFSNFGKSFSDAYTGVFNRLGLPQAADHESLSKDYDEAFLKILGDFKPEQIEAMRIQGVEPFLKNIQTGKFPMAIATGNSQVRAVAIIRALGYAKYFITGGFDDDIANNPQSQRGRAFILKAALNKLSNKNLIFKPEQSVVIGDTESDFYATAPEGHKTTYAILVATGGRSLEQLDVAKVISGSGASVIEIKPDLVLPALHLTGNREKDAELLKRITKR